MTVKVYIVVGLPVGGKNCRTGEKDCGLGWGRAGKEETLRVTICLPGPNPD